MQLFRQLSRQFSRNSVSPAGSRSTRRRHLTLLLSTCALGAGLILPPSLLQAQELPTGGTIAAGTGSIGTSGSTMTVTQTSNQLITNWNSFSIGSGATVNFVQPGASSMALNRVTGQDPSQILGNLNANGQVFLINPNGVAIGTSGRVQTGAFVASTLGITDSKFLAHDFNFTGSGGAITNAGEISGAVVALIAPTVRNSGTITGDTALAAGTDVLLDFDGDGLISVEVKASTMEALAENSGLIKADGGSAILTARGASEAKKGIVNNTGTVEAKAIGSRNGRILLLGSDETHASGSLKAKFVETSAKKVKLDKTLKVETDGGDWLIDPTDINIDADMAASIETGLASGNVKSRPPLWERMQAISPCPPGSTGPPMSSHSGPTGTLPSTPRSTARPPRGWRCITVRAQWRRATRPPTPSAPPSTLLPPAALKRSWAATARSTATQSLPASAQKAAPRARTCRASTATLPGSMCSAAILTPRPLQGGTAARDLIRWAISPPLLRHL
ncbi:filamentous hemagglutinin N-terminal domain-containing protein [Pannonibacter sp. Pt2-lr]